MAVPMLLSIFLWHGQSISVAGEKFSHKTMVDPRDVYLGIEAMSGAEGLPYRYMHSPEEHVRTKIDPRDKYLDMEALSGAEGMPYRYMMLPSEYVPVTHQPENINLDVEKMLSEDPSFVQGQPNY
jgi:hypothetical protein